MNLRYLEIIISEMNDCGHWGISGIVDKAVGIRQEDHPIDDCPFDHTYVDQNQGPVEDSFYGDEYFPLEDGRYLKVWFEA
jgi:hypothetical protein